MLHGSNSTEVEQLLAKLQNNAEGRDPSWWDLKNKPIIAWSIIDDCASSCIQEFGSDVRLITRCYIEPEYRANGLQQYGDYVFQMIQEQLEYAREQGYNNAFISTEGNRVGVIKRHARIASERYGLTCIPLDGKYRTCNGAPEHCSQNIGLYPLTDKEFGLSKYE